MTKKIVEIAGEGIERTINYVADSEIGVQHFYSVAVHKKDTSKMDLVITLSSECSK